MLYERALTANARYNRMGLAARGEPSTTGKYMGNIRSTAAAFMAVAWLTAFGVCVAVPPATEARAHSDRDTAVDEEFQAMLARVDAAQLELQNGRSKEFKALWSQADDITLSGGFGGTIEKGWEQVSRRLDWVGAQFSKGTNTIERVTFNAHGDLGYVVQIEHIRFHIPGQTNASTRDFRVTMLFRRELEGWRIIHRQADSQMIMQAPH